MKRVVTGGTSPPRGASTLTKLASNGGYMWVGNGVRFAVKGGRVVGRNGGVGRTRTQGGRATGSVHALSCRLGALHGMDVESCAIGGERGVRDWGRDSRSDRWTVDGDGGACRDTFVWDGA